MIWLIVHEWLLLITAFFLGVLVGWWIWARRQADVGVAYRSPAEVTAGSPAAPAAASAHQTKPALYDTASDGPADDLKKISGIGPKYERLLNEMGIYYYRQIAGWTAEEVSWLEERLAFPGRIARDKWQQQAELLLSEDGAPSTSEA